MKRVTLAIILGMLALVPAWSAGDKVLAAERPAQAGSKISLDFQNAPVRHILQLIADVSGRNFLISEDVKGTITLKLNNVQWDHALDLVLRMEALGKVTEGNIIRIDTLANLSKQEDEEGKLRDTQSKAVDLTTRVIGLHYVDAANIQKMLSEGSSFLTPRGKVGADVRTNSLIVKDIPSVVADVTRLVQSLDTPTPQVTIEARIVQVRPTFSQNLGIQWGGGFTHYGKSSTFGVQGIDPTSATQPGFGVFAPGFAVNLPQAEAVGGVGFTFGKLTGTPFSLDMRISAGEAKGLTRIISTPKITVLDNQTAKIEQGESIPFQTVSQTGTQTQFYDANLTLEVTPHITGDGKVSMKIRVAKNLPGEQRSSAGPSILKREASTYVLLNNGETTVIGGIYESTKVDSSTGIPGLSKLPLIGFLFKNNSTRDTTEELLVFITPHTVE